MLMTTVVAETMTQPSKIVMDANWKWDATAGPRWVAPFMGTNDQIKLPMEVMTQKLSSFAAEEVELVSVVGGMKYLWILALRDFSAVTFFDMNINELTKLRICNEHILSHSYDEWKDGEEMLSVYNKLVADTRRSFLPASLYEDGVTYLQTKDFVWPRKGRHLYEDPVEGREGPMWALFQPKKFPEFSWHPTRQEYEQVKQNLLRVNERFYLGLPIASAAPNRLAVVWVDGVSIPYGRVLCVSPTAMSIGIYADISGGHEWTDTDPNSMWYDAHFWWEIRVRLSTRGRYQHLGHFWAPEDSEFQSTAYDWPFFHTAIVDTEMAFRHNILSFPVKITTAVFHLFLGKASAPGDCMVRKAGFIEYIRKLIAGSDGLQRIVITEPNADSADVDAPCAIPSTELLHHLVPQITNGSSFTLRAAHNMAGETSADKNILLILDNQVHDHLLTPHCEGPAAAYDAELENRSLWTMANLGAIIDYKETGKKRAVNFFGLMGAAPAIMEQFTGVQAAIFMMLSPLQHIELANYMVDPRLEMKTFQSLWPDGTKESFALN
jgi:hypothetical protein